MEIKREKLRGIRKTIGTKLLESLNTIPHATLMTTVDMTELAAIRQAYKLRGESLSTTAFLLKAVAIVLEKYPQLNTRLEDEEIIYYDSADAGVAVDTPRGLMVVTIRDIQEKSIQQITVEMRETIRNLKEGKATLDDMTGSTFTVSNESMSSNDYFNSIINNNECLIIGLARYKKQLVVNDDNSISIRQIGNIMVNYNHMLADGMPVAAFISEISRLMSDPANGLIECKDLDIKDTMKKVSIQNLIR